VAVQDISFLVKRRECFALLGVNGAGKTTTFKILTGEFSPSGGSVHINGLSIMNEIPEIRNCIGYCPQFDSVTDLLTGKEHLELYARIKGIPKRLIPDIVAAKIREMDLTAFQHVRAGNYSGGNKRKLSVAIACIGNPPVVFLDEPSAGLDPEARRKMWKVISQIKSMKTSLIFTTHYIEEAEILCDRIGIMVAGRFKCIGSSWHIKEKFGEGYEFVLKTVAATPEEA
jgi:ATP-binding cassette subfamily A (ABC1) protein 3